MLSLPRVAVLRSFVMNHVIHHRLNWEFICGSTTYRYHRSMVRRQMKRCKTEQLEKLKLDGQILLWILAEVVNHLDAFGRELISRLSRASSVRSFPTVPSPLWAAAAGYRHAPPYC